MSMTDIDALLGRVLAGKYEIRELLGVGAMGKVYRAHHIGLNKAVAIKVLIRIPAIEDAQAIRFKREAQAASRIEHPHAVTIKDFGEEQDGLLYIVMEYLEGIDLQDRIASQGPQSSERVAWIMSQAFSALSAAHAADVIHRDIKPGNIMLIEKRSEDGPISDFVKVCDFGLAKIVDGGMSLTGGPLTKQGAVFGTPAYMSPEQARGLPLDTRSDIYSCAVVMYKMLVGHTPFRAETPAGVLVGHIQETPPALTSWGIEIHPEMVRVVERAMAKDPADRFQDARDARDALRKLLDSEGWSRPPATVAAPMVPRPATNVPTEQVRLRGDQVPTEYDADRTELARPPVQEDPTRYADTVPPPVATSAPVSAAPKPEPARAEPAPAPTPGGPPAWWALVPGALALIVALSLLAFILMERAPEPARSPERPVMVPAAPAEGRAPPPAPREPAPGPAEAAPTGAASPVEAGAAPAPESPPPTAAPAKAARRTPRRRAAPTKASAAPAPREATPAAAAVTPPPAPTPLPSAGAKPSLGPKMPRQPRPEALAEDFELALTLGKVSIDGALSRTRCQDALTRHLDKASACLRPLVAGAKMRTAGEVTATGQVDDRGRLRDIEASGLTGAAACLKGAFSMARLPKADMGMVRIRFVLRYRTVNP